MLSAGWTELRAVTSGPMTCESMVPSGDRLLYWQSEQNVRCMYKYFLRIFVSYSPSSRATFSVELGRRYNTALVTYVHYLSGYTYIRRTMRSVKDYLVNTIQVA